MTDEQDALVDETYGAYSETPHVAVTVNFPRAEAVLTQVLEYRAGPPIAWAYDNHVLFLWGDELDEDLLGRLADACNELEREYSREGLYQDAKSVSRAAKQLLGAEIRGPEAPKEDVIRAVERGMREHGTVTFDGNEWVDEHTLGEAEPDYIDDIIHRCNQIDEIEGRVQEFTAYFRVNRGDEAGDDS